MSTVRDLPKVTMSEFDTAVKNADLGIQTAMVNEAGAIIAVVGLPLVSHLPAPDPDPLLEIEALDSDEAKGGQVE